MLGHRIVTDYLSDTHAHTEVRDRNIYWKKQVVVIRNTAGQDSELFGSYLLLITLMYFYLIIPVSL